MTIDTPAAIARLMRFLAIEGITGQEAKIAADIRAVLLELGVPASAMKFDDANTHIPLPTQTGNLIVQLPGTRPGPGRLFMTHMDTVPLCAGAQPVLHEKRITNAANTALGGDNRTGCAALVTLVAELFRQKLPHPPLTLLFTVREESGLFGAKHLNPTNLGGPTLGFNIDGRNAAELVVGAIGADRWEVDIQGKASHAGVHPDKGISATMIAALAMAEVHATGWFGKVVKGEQEGTSNVGQFGDANGASAGNATNVVTDVVHIKGESRSHDAKFVREITAAFKVAFQDALKQVKDHQGKTGKLKFTSRLDYVPFRIAPDSPVVKLAMQAAKTLRMKPTTKITNGGLDANWMVKHGIPTVTFGAGQNDIHTVKEWVDLKEFEAGCRLAVAIATME
ncbi:MAG: M20/M25/M40 family metallo-hydrolase [Gemmataceae bacterium]